MSQQTSVKNIFWYQGRYTAVYKIALTLVSAMLIAASARVQIPLQPVPVTLQTFVVVLLAMAMGWRYGLAATMSYLVMGAVGLPVFANVNTGIAYLFGPTGGYLLAFPLISVCVGWMTERGAGKHVWSSLLAASLGLLLILSLGSFYLSFFVGTASAFKAGFVPFVLAELCKAIMIAVIVPRVWRFAK